MYEIENVIQELSLTGYQTQTFYRLGCETVMEQSISMPDKCFQRTQEGVMHPRNSFCRDSVSERPEQGQVEKEMKGRCPLQIQMQKLGMNHHSGTLNPTGSGAEGLFRHGAHG